MAVKKEAVKDAAEKVAAEVKTEVVKQTPKKATRKAAGTAAKKTAAKTAETAAKKTVKKAAEKAAAKKEVVMLEFNDKQVAVEDIVAAVKADFKANNKGAVKTVNVYVKPEDNAAYYVVNGVEGKVDL